jgi:hypothetical protein
MSLALNYLNAAQLFLVLATAIFQINIAENTNNFIFLY